MAATAVAAVAVFVALVALAWCAALARRVRDLTSIRGDLARMAADGDLMRMAGIIEQRLEALERADEHLHRDDVALAEKVAHATRHVGVVRFDALPGLAGMFSFSVAMLDDMRDGVVLTSIYGRSESRQYVKPIEAGKSDVALTDEEADAIARAFGEPVADGRGRRG